MTLRKHTLIVSGIFLSVLLAVVYLITMVFLFKGFGAIELTYSRDHLARVNESFKSLIDNLVVKSADWAVWSDTYQFVADRNEAYKISNLGDVSFENLQINGMVFIDDQKQVVFKKYYDLPSQKELDFPESLLSHFVNSSPFVRTEDLDAVFSGIIMEGKVPYLFVSRPILTSEHTGPARGTMVFLRKFGPMMLEKLTTTTKLPIKVLPLDDQGEAREISSLSLANPYLIEVENAHTMEGFDLIHDAYGKPAFVFFVEIDRGIFHQAISTAWSVGISLLAVVAFFLGCMIVVLRRLIFDRLKKLDEEIGGLGETNISGRRLTVKGQDELDKVALTINRMLDQLERYQQDLNAKMEELVKAKQEADHASQAKSQFLANMSHEIRTPLNAVLGFSEVLRQTPLSPQQVSYLDLVTASSKALLSTISDILDVSKIEQGKMEFESIDFDLKYMLDETCNIIRGTIESKGLQLTKDISEDLPRWVKGDPVRLRQVLINLLGNAAKFTSKGRVHLGVAREPELDGGATIGLRFNVTDTGIGIAKYKIDMIFEPFAQADSSTTRRFGGSGLGLAISKNLVESMGGRMWCTSKLGEGTQFFFTVALAKGQMTVPVDHSQLATTGTVDFGRLRILVAEDSPTNQQLMKTLFSLFGCQADYVNNGQEAVDRLREDSGYDLCFMDLQMPILGGVEATAFIRKNISATLPIVALTAAVTSKDQADAFKAGVNDFLAKPVNLDKLKGIIIQYSQRPQQ